MGIEHGGIAPPWTTTSDGKLLFNYPRLPLSVLDSSASGTLASWYKDNATNYPDWISRDGKYNGSMSVRTNSMKLKGTSSSDPYMSPWTDITDTTPRAALHPLTGTCMELYNPLVPAPAKHPRQPEQEQKSIFMCYGNSDETDPSNKHVPLHNGLMCPVPQSGSGYNQSCYAMWEASTGKSAMDNCNQWLTQFYSDPDNSDVTSPSPTLCSSITLGDSCWEDNLTSFASSGALRSGTPSSCTFPYLLSSCPSPLQESCSLFTGELSAVGTCKAYDTLCGACVDNNDCPTGQTCNVSTKRCESPCDGISCPSTKSCVDGVCLVKCGSKVCSAGEKCCNVGTDDPSCTGSSNTCPANACAKANCNPTTSDGCYPNGTCQCNNEPECTHGNHCTHGGGCSCGGGPACLGAQECLVHAQTQTYACGVCAVTCTNGNQCTTEGDCVCGQDKGCTGDSQCEKGVCKKATPGGASSSTTNSHTTRNVILAVVVTLVVILAIILGVYFGLKHKHNRSKALV